MFSYKVESKQQHQPPQNSELFPTLLKKLIFFEAWRFGEIIEKTAFGFLKAGNINVRTAAEVQAIRIAEVQAIRIAEGLTVGFAIGGMWYWYKQKEQKKEKEAKELKDEKDRADKAELGIIRLKEENDALKEKLNKKGWFWYFA